MAMTQNYYSVINSEPRSFLLFEDGEARRGNDAKNARLWNWNDPPEWPMLRMETVRVNMGKHLKPIDVTTLPEGIVCSPSAFRFISPLLQRGGVNLPLHVDDGQIWSYFFMDMSGDNIPFAKITSKGVMRRNHSDMTKPLPKVPKEGVFQWRRDKHLGADFAAWLEFDPESIDGRDVFLAAYRQQFFEKVGITVPFTRLFVSERFVQAVVDAELQGLDFISVSKPEDSLWYTDPSDHQR
jgi:hypothetical protein